MNVDPDATRPQIRPHPSRDGIQVTDPIQETQFSLLTPDEPGIDDCDPDEFYFPADAGATVRTTAVETPYFVPLWIRDAEGNTVAEVSDQESVSVPPGRYNVELATTQVKLQFAIEGGIEVTSMGDTVRIALSETDRIHVGARSVHEQPAATVTTTEQPEDLMRALSTLGSALKTTSCERSFPSLRGHPPLVELGDRLDVPDSIAAPETGVGIEVPPIEEYIYPVVPLAYYTGARIEPGPSPRIAGEDWSFPLDGDDGFEAEVERVLKHVFLMDCVTRTEGYYEVDLHERAAVESLVDLDFADVYERPLSEQLRAYLDVPFDAVAEVVPKWKLTADVRPDAANVSALPFLANELAVVRCPHSQETRDEALQELTDQVESFFRNNPEALRRSTRTQTRSESSPSTATSEIFRPEPADSIEQAYVGEGLPVGASKMTVDAYYRRLEFEPTTDPQIQVAVVCNDQEMTDENVVSEIYGTRDWIEFGIEAHEQLTAMEMRELLRSEIDFLHYIGHVDDEGIRCADGYLDTRHLSEVNVSAFLLNACDSYEQGRGLVDAGAMAGIATVTDIVNEAATSVGHTAAKLLNQGFSLAATVSIIKEYEQIGHHYLVVGDASASIVENQSGTPHRVVVDRPDPSEYRVSIYGYPSLSTPMGTVFSPVIDGINRFYMNSGKMDEYELSDEQLRSFIYKQDLPVEFDGALRWSSELNDI
ncbi:hypothetical protein HZS55_20825 [Halosimplex rubrum]|uniref:CHAT domain-containing protein n=1 Tax=Halosimplex rubrum TaxID=869889 RepID=A0A7D5P778_9EURY|nr:hypothetical protein [Halosimplex rubrum]QLH79585.1 hypothetical protein HZS55_20825 [Halosimplex rubrum]